MDFALRRASVRAVNDHIWLLNDNDEATGYVVAGTARALVIDSMTGLVNVREEAERLTGLPLTLVNTHGHSDHIGGNWSFDKAYLHPADLSLAQAFLDLPMVREISGCFSLRFPAFDAIDEGDVFDLGGIHVEVWRLPGHTAGEIVLLDREDRILFSGDGVIEQIWLQLEESLPISTQIAAMERLAFLRPAFDTILTGHSRGPEPAELYDAMLSAARSLVAGDGASDVEYRWHGGVCKAHPYGREPRRIVYREIR
ncbi:MAG: MBL fold metallo-hydrolase [Clostridia bacterium]|nr:MBL fold metallo-hydrolase [Clostridia bacterium]